MTGTDYNAIVADLNRPTAMFKDEKRPKAQPNNSHAIGSTRQPLVMLTGDGRGAERYPARNSHKIEYISKDERERNSKRTSKLRETAQRKSDAGI